MHSVDMHCLVSSFAHLTWLQILDSCCHQSGQRKMPGMVLVTVEESRRHSGPALTRLPEGVLGGSTVRVGHSQQLVVK